MSAHSGGALDFDAINRAALHRSEDLLRNLFPAGKSKGREYKVGSVRGEAGASLSINTESGVWSDFATGQAGSDLISLYAEVHGLSQSQAARELDERLGGPSAAVNGPNGHRHHGANGAAARAPKPVADSSDWQPIMPVPADAPPPPAEHFRHGAPMHIAAVRDAGGVLLHYIYRCEPKGERKAIAPLTYGDLGGRLGWHWKAPPSPRPLYGLDCLSALPDAPVLLVEGEKKRDTTHGLLVDAVATLSWPNGAQGVDQSDPEPLRGKRVFIWPDNDKAGAEAAAAMAKHLRGIAASVSIVPVPEGRPEGWDLGDAVNEGWTARDVLDHLGYAEPDNGAGDAGERARTPEPDTEETEQPLLAQEFEWQPPSTIPPREWLMGTTALREFVTVLVAPGGVGKTAYAVTAALAFVAKRPLLGDHIFQAAPAWILNLEDPHIEIQRRIQAAMIHHNIRPDEIRGRLFVNSGRDRRLRMACYTSRFDRKQTQIVHPDKLAVISEALRLKCGLIVVDPFINSHELDENSNDEMNAAVRAWAEVAAAAKCAVILVHHMRKGVTQPGDIEGGRGAKALVDGSRVGLTLTAMTPDEADQCGVPLVERWRYIRLDDGKQSMAPRADRARWYHLASVDLGNRTASYPSGDNVQAIEPWTPQSPAAAHSDDDLNAVLDAIERGLPNGHRYGASARGGSKRWAGDLLIEKLRCTPEQAKSIIASWLKTGLLFEDQYRDTDKGRELDGLWVNATKRPGNIP